MSTREPLEALLDAEVKEIIADVLVGTHSILPRSLEHTRSVVKDRIKKLLQALAASAEPQVNGMTKAEMFERLEATERKAAEPIEKNIATISKSEPASTPAAPQSMEELRALLEDIFHDWDIFHAKLPDGEYAGLGAIRTSILIAKRDLKAALARTANGGKEK